jgi:hypothetical protein
VGVHEELRLLAPSEWPTMYLTAGREWHPGPVVRRHRPGTRSGLTAAINILHNDSCMAQITIGMLIVCVPRSAAKLRPLRPLRLTPALVRRPTSAVPGLHRQDIARQTAVIQKSLSRVLSCLARHGSENCPACSRYVSIVSMRLIRPLIIRPIGLGCCSRTLFLMSNLAYSSYPRRQPTFASHLRSYIRVFSITSLSGYYGEQPRHSSSSSYLPS